MLIACPLCGDRPDPEFRSAGEALERPADPQALDDRQWADYLYHRSNVPGVAVELWWHALGCRQWLRVERDTVGHRIHRVSLALDVPLVKADGHS